MRLQQRSEDFHYAPLTERPHASDRSKSPLCRLLTRREHVLDVAMQTSGSRDTYAAVREFSATNAMPELLRARAIRTTTMRPLHLRAQMDPDLRAAWYGNVLGKFTLWCQERSDIVTVPEIPYLHAELDTPDYYTRSPEVLE